MTLTKDWFFNHTGMERRAVESLVDESLHGMDDGELFLEYAQSESLVFDDGRIKNASFNTLQGFGLRSVYGEATGFAHSNDMSLDAIRRAGDTVKAVSKTGESFKHAEQFGVTDIAGIAPLYMEGNPIGEVSFEDKVELLGKIDAYVRSKHPNVKQVSASIFGEWQVVEILRVGGESARDVRPLVRLNVSVTLEKDGRMENGSSGAGGRVGYANYINEAAWQAQADEALRRAEVNMQSIPAPAGEMPVVLGNAWCGVLLHEAVGHGLEGDFNRKKTSAFSGLVGEQVAAKGVTVVDNGIMPDRRGSLTIDDEGTPTQETVLIEDGILKGYMQDRLNARLMGVPLTGNGRRESYADLPLPRMTNTYMLNGNSTQEEMISSVKNGIYAANFGGGQVDITSGKFVFSASEAYLIENGKITQPIKGATLIGNGPDSMRKVTAIGNDLALDNGVGTCGKAGQSVPVGVGQPSMLISAMTVGGTEV